MKGISSTKNNLSRYLMTGGSQMKQCYDIVTDESWNIMIVLTIKLETWRQPDQ